MELKEAFELVVNTINETFKEGMFGIEEANTIITSVNVVGRALSAEKRIEEKMEEASEIESPKKVARNKK